MRKLGRKTFLSAGTAMALAVVIPPLSTFSQELFAGHMAQHLILIAIAAPLIARGLRISVSPVGAWVAFVSTFLFWHWPVAFQWAAGALPTQLLEHGSILVTAALFWSAAFSRNELGHGARAIYVMTAAVITDLPGVVMLFAPRAICTMPGENAPAFGLTPLEDQQIAGLLMWVPANLVFFSIAIWLLSQWISPQRRVMPT
ncbi:MAG TPA: cytochrome c oxidase assembly protein [Rhizomicrobium sp.]|jgi:cytochrome c oxidase assembly factor CtaG|nr:cytochrome c oxidase assembly protein [Rhizomicrobium sp.]